MQEQNNESVRLSYFETLAKDIREKLPESFIEDVKRWKDVMQHVNTVIFLLDDSCGNSKRKEQFKHYEYNDFCKLVMEAYKEFFDEYPRNKIERLFVTKEEYEHIQKDASSEDEKNEKTKRLVRGKLNRFIYLPLEEYTIKKAVKNNIPEDCKKKIEDVLK